MSLKIEGKAFVCYNQCGSDCCGEIFLPMTPKQRYSFENKGFWLVSNNYTDFKWLSYHKSIEIKKDSSGWRKLSFDKKKPFEIIFNPFTNNDELHIKDKCKMLLPNGRCKVYRARPETCQKAECPIFTLKKSIRFYAENGLLKDVLKLVRK